ncbi:MAG TPA: CPBP family intramembrane metalloprotease [Clostridiales bacterium]|jgi:membrane protease YdiL (CAAX protease family)|nr:CPBP family intramembrane metalloprotease [Clostridiales bacterium]
MKSLKSIRVLYGMITFVLLLVMQELLVWAARLIANLIPYQGIDPYDCFAGISIQQAIILIIALLIILVLGKQMNLNFYYQLGDKKRGIKYLTIFTAVFVVISILQHTYMTLTNQLPVYTFPLDGRNIIGTLGFNLLLTGPTEESLFRALPIILLINSFGNSIKIKGNVTLEVILASILFSFAHVRWSIIPLHFEADYYQLIYAFAMGTIQGIVYQKTKSILYPALMHSISNVLMVGGGYVFTALFS